MILLTGATGVVGSALLQRLLQRGRARSAASCATRGGWARTASGSRSRSGTWRTPSPCARPCGACGPSCTWRRRSATSASATIEELNGLATARLLRYAEAAGVERFVFFGALGATPSSRTRFFRAKALAERAVAASPIDATVLSPSIVYAPGDPFMSLLRRLSLLPWMPISGSGRPALPADLGRGRGRVRPPRAARRLPRRRPPPRAGRPGGPELRGDRAARADCLGPPAAAAPRAAVGRPAGPRRARAAGGHRRRSRPGRRRS